MERFDNTEDFLHDSWHLLIKSAARRKGDYQKPSVSTLGNNGFPQQRIVVLRDVDLSDRLLTFFTDARSEKVKELEETPRLSWLFWDKRKKVQIRMAGNAFTEQGTDRCRGYWDNLPVQGRASYALLTAPGTAQEDDSVPLPEYWNKDIDLEKTAYAFKNFMVVTCQVETADLLHLHHEGHQRALYQYQDNQWNGHWAAP